MLMNKSLLKLLKIKESQMSKMNIADIMPAVIAENHQSFTLEYNRTGESRLLHKRRALFIKDSNSCLLPISFLV